MTSDSKPINLEGLRKQFRGTQYKELVQEHYHKTGKKIEIAAFGYMQMLPQTQLEIASELTDQCNQLCIHQNFLNRDCCEAFDYICNTFKERAEEKGITATEDEMFSMFQAITLNFALMAREEKEFRRHTGISKYRGILGFFLR